MHNSLEHPRPNFWTRLIGLYTLLSVMLLARNVWQGSVRELALVPELIPLWLERMAATDVGRIYLVRLCFNLFGLLTFAWTFLLFLFKRPSFPSLFIASRVMMIAFWLAYAVLNQNGVDLSVVSTARGREVGG